MTMINTIAGRRPVDATAARVVSPGPKHLESSKRITQTMSDAPLPMLLPLPRHIADLRGKTVGRLTVVGASKPTDTAQRQIGNHRLWVCRCVCGRYLTRRAKAINNPKNVIDACDHCRHVDYLRRHSTLQQTGLDSDI